jgi:hypothetical protein
MSSGTEAEPLPSERDAMGDEADGRGPGGDSANDSKSESPSWSWIVLLLGILFVVLVAGSFSYLMTKDDSAAVRALPTPSSTKVVEDNFDRPASATSMGRARGGAAWTSVGGTWAIAAGAAYLPAPVEGDNFALIDVGANASSRAQVAGGQGCGVVGNYVDPSNYLALVFAPKFGVWNLNQVSGGKSETLLTLPDTKDINEKIALEVNLPVITISVGLQHVSVIRDGVPKGTLAGLYARGLDSHSCTFDDVVLSVPSK